MPRRPVADVEIAGKPYTLAKPPFGIRLGFQGKEPGQPGLLQTIEIPSFHLGPGEFLAQTPGRFWQSYGMEVGVPAAVGRVGIPVAVTGVADILFETSSATPSFYTGGALLVTPTDGAAAERIVMVGNREIVVFDAGTELNGISLDAGGGTSYTGSLAKHKGIVYFGVETNPGRVAAKLARYNPKTHAFLAEFSGAAAIGSRVLSSRGLFWWVQNAGLGNVPVLRATDSPADPPPAGTVGPFNLSPGDYCTGLARFGYWIRYAMADGNLHGIDDEGVIAPFLPDASAAPGSTSGTQMVSFLGRIAIGSPGRIHTVDLSTLQVVDISPPALQGEAEWAPGAHTPILWSDGIELWAAVGSTIDSTKAELWRLTVYPDGSPAWHRVAAFALAGDTAPILPYALIIWDGGTAGRYAYILYQRGNNATGKIVKVRVPRPGNQPPISSSFDTTNTRLDTSLYRAGLLVTAKFLQLRGFQRLTPNPSFGVDYNIDGGAYAALGTLAASGPFSMAFPASAAAVGRLVGLRLKTDPGQLAMPLYLDYLEIPSATDDLTIDILASDLNQNNRGSSFRQEGGRLGVVETLRALKHGITTLSFMDSLDAQGKPTSWTVLVVDVLVQALKAGAEKTDDATVSLQIRRL